MNHVEVDVHQFKGFFEGDSFVLIDVRTPEEYSTGHLKNAKNIDFYLNTFEDEIDSLDKRKKYLVYCKSGSRSRQTMFLMRDLGFEEVYNLSGGIMSWYDQGYQVEK